MDNENNFNFNSENNTVNSSATFNYSNENKFKKSKSSKSNPGFGKSVLVPFISGIIGATLVVGTCFGVPSIKSTLLSAVLSRNSAICFLSKSELYLEICNFLI